MRMFDIITPMIDIMKSKITLVSDDNFFDYEPGDGSIDYKKVPAIFVYDFETNFSDSERDVEGSQDHEPIYYIDVIVSQKAESASGTITSSAKKASDELRAIVSEVYNALMWQRFIIELSEEEFINTAYVSRIEKLGTSKTPESQQTIMAQRLFFKVKMNELPPGDDGIDFDDTIDEIDPQLPE